MSNHCTCVASILNLFPFTLLNIIQAYVHNRTCESFYKTNCKDFNFCVRLNKELNIVEELKLKFSCLLGNTPEMLNVNSFFIDIVKGISPRNNSSRWLDINFVVNSTRYSFIRCLTSSTKYPPNKRIPDSSHRYRNVQVNLVRYFGEGNQNTLLTEIAEQCGVEPLREDYERIWNFLNTKIAAWLVSIDLWGEIHKFH